MKMTQGERLELSRRRLGLTKAQMAEWLGVSIYTYRNWERDTEVSQTTPRPDPQVGELAPGEWCWLQRRRAGLRLRDVAEDMQVPVKWVQRAEYGESKNNFALVNWWRMYTEK